MVKGGCSLGGNDTFFLKRTDSLRANNHGYFLAIYHEGLLL